MRNFSKNNINKFKAELGKLTWLNVTQCLNANIAYNNFFSSFKDLYDKHFPLQKVKINQKNQQKPWITRGIVKSSKTKQKLYNKYLKNKSPTNKSNYTNFKHLFEKIKAKSKNKYYHNRLSTLKNNSKKTWATIREVIGSKKTI